MSQGGNIFKKKGMLNLDSKNIMFGGTVVTGKNAFYTSGQIPKESIEEFVDPQCQPSVNVDPMEVEGPSSLRVGLAVNKGKGLARGVHLFRGICKKPRKKRSVVQEMSNSLKSMSDVIVESRSVNTHAPFASIATTKVKAILDMMLSLPGVVIAFICSAPSFSWKM